MNKISADYLDLVKHYFLQLVRNTDMVMQNIFLT